MDVIGPAARLRRAGLVPVPHIASRHIQSAEQLEQLAARLAGEADVDCVLVIGGDRISRQGGPIVIETRLHHDTISALRGVQVDFELLNGITLEQAGKILGVLNENVVGVVVTTALDVKTEAASG